MSTLGAARENWRILLLVFFVVASAVFLFVPGLGAGGGGGGGATANTTSGPTNLQFGIDLSGGTRIRAPLVGITAEEVDLNGQDPGEVSTAVERELGIARGEVQVRLPDEQGDTTSVELFNEEIVESENGQQRFIEALRAAGVEVEAGDVRAGVTDETVAQAQEVLGRKVSSAGLSGGSVQTARSPDGQAFIVVEVPGEERSDVIDLISERGRVLVVAHFPTQNGSRNVSMFDQEGIASVQSVQTGQRGGYEVPLSLTQPAAENFSNSMRQFGFTGRGAESCRYSQAQDQANAGYCIYTIRNGQIGQNGNIVQGEIVSAASMSSGLASTIESGDFVQQPDFVITSPSQQEAQELRINLNAGALPTDLALDRGTSSFLSPSLGSQFKSLSLLTGLLAIGAVAVSVFIRYRRPGVAIPMLFTAAAEVFILLGFSALIGLAINLSFIAGFIAVIGTGVDDLVIIADEIMQGGEVNTDRVFESRFRKAFWVIGAAAATTIIAMSPLAVLSLGDLRGFAIVTIVGVLIGVLVTRPAYGDILRNIVLD